jgi:hypothetical protein
MDRGISGARKVDLTMCLNNPTLNVKRMIDKLSVVRIAADLKDKFLSKRKNPAKWQGSIFELAAKEFLHNLAW